MCRPSLVHPMPVRRLRDLTRYRRTLIRERSREKQRLEKILEDAQVKLDTVIASLYSVSGRAMIEAMIAGERNPKVLAAMARGVMRRKIPQLEEALRGHFDDHHGFICATMLRRIDAISMDIATIDVRITELLSPYLDTIERLDQIPGVGTRSAQELIAEVGLDMGAFPTAAHLVSWAKFARPTGNTPTGSLTHRVRHSYRLHRVPSACPLTDRFSSQPRSARITVAHQLAHDCRASPVGGQGPTHTPLESPSHPSQALPCRSARDGSNPWDGSKRPSPRQAYVCRFLSTGYRHFSHLSRPESNNTPNRG